MSVVERNRQSNFYGLTKQIGPWRSTPADKYRGASGSTGDDIYTMHPYKIDGSKPSPKMSVWAQRRVVTKPYDVNMRKPVPGYQFKQLPTIGLINALKGLGTRGGPSGIDSGTQTVGNDQGGNPGAPASQNPGLLIETEDESFGTADGDSGETSGSGSTTPQQTGLIPSVVFGVANAAGNVAGQGLAVVNNALIAGAGAVVSTVGRGTGNYVVNQGLNQLATSTNNALFSNEAALEGGLRMLGAERYIPWVRENLDVLYAGFRGAERMTRGVVQRGAGVAATAAFNSSGMGGVADVASTMFLNYAIEKASAAVGGMVSTITSKSESTRNAIASTPRESLQITIGSSASTSDESSDASSPTEKLVKEYNELAAKDKLTAKEKRRKGTLQGMITKSRNKRGVVKDKGLLK